MNETDKPFACSEKGCEMTFTNEDHINWHKKKHEMMLNLGLSKNDVADQTPTPTRFIRNCEEVGLFQDLQNENPFDEHFKRAIELVKNGRTLEVPETNSDDTLHTPHILPHVEENRKKPIQNNSQDDTNSRSNEFSLNGVIPLENMCTNEVNNKESTSTPIIVIDDDSNGEKDIKKRIKDALQNKEKQRMNKENCGSAGGSNNTVSVVPFKNLTEEREKSQNIDKNNEAIIDENREKIREMNRAAQIRCRRRKQIKWKEMEEEIIILKNENKRLKLENCKLQSELGQIKKSLVGIESSKTTNVPAVLPQILPDLNGTSTNPIVIQIIPSTSNSTLPVTEGSLPDIKIQNVYSLSKTSSSGRSNDCGQQKVNKALRKIIPKIVIEN